jgi:hypothetical protein
MAEVTTGEERDPLLLRVNHILAAAEAALRSYENGNGSPVLAREVADALATLRADLQLRRERAESPASGFIVGMLLRPTVPMIEAGVRVIEGAPELEADDLLVEIIMAVVRAGLKERENARRTG